VGGRLAAARRISLGVDTSRDAGGTLRDLTSKTNDFQAEQRILGLRWKRTRLRRGKELAEAPCKPMRLRQFRGLVSWG
jgi:hypothetical protein